VSIVPKSISGAIREESRLHMSNSHTLLSITDAARTSSRIPPGFRVRLLPPPIDVSRHAHLGIGESWACNTEITVPTCGRFGHGCRRRGGGVRLFLFENLLEQSHGDGGCWYVACGAMMMVIVACCGGERRATEDYAVRSCWLGSCVHAPCACFPTRCCRMMSGSSCVLACVGCGIDVLLLPIIRHLLFLADSISKTVNSNLHDRWGEAERPAPYRSAVGSRLWPRLMSGAGFALAVSEPFRAKSERAPLYHHYSTFRYVTTLSRSFGLSFGFGDRNQSKAR